MEISKLATMTLDAMLFDFGGVIVEFNTIKTEAFRDLFVNEREHVDAIFALHRINPILFRQMSKQSKIFPV